MDKLHNIIFFATLGILGVLVIVLPKKEESETEKRPLAQFPEISWQLYLENKITKGIDKYISDHFPFRDELVEFSFLMKRNRGLPSEEIAFYDGAVDTDINEDAEGGEVAESATASGFVGNKDSIVFNEGNASDVEHLNHKILIYKGKAIQLFGGTNTTEKYGKSTLFTANVTNEYRDSLHKTTQVYLAITPSSGELLLPSEYQNKKVSERKNIDSIYKYLHPGVRKVDICLELHQHKDEYLYFGTDHHWTGRAAYYGYVAWCRSAGLTPVPLEQLERKVIHGFLGTLYRTTRDERLAQNPDSVEYFKVRVKHKSYALSGAQYELREGKRMYAEIASGVNSYGVFLGKDYPAYMVETDVNNGKVALVIKNSYGNPFATYLASHFERVFVIDYRKFKNNIIDFCRKHKVTDLILFQNTFSANTSSHTEMIRKMIHAPNKSVALAREADIFVEKPKEEAKKKGK